jgi:hypothetical protein
MKVMALVLLLWTAVDLCVPMVCPSEDQSVEFASTAGMQDQASRAIHAKSPISGDIDDDCFCCCSHIFY